MIEQIAIACSRATWTRDGSIPDHPEAHVGEWAFLLVVGPGYEDGTAMSAARGVVCRLTPGMARMARARCI